ncbi:glycosyltransferase [Jeongeupia chitinilytica]|nr:glycosyltransferase [Jeongeupia chitinilytica]
MGFDRLIQAVDAWAGLHPEVELYCQIGDGQYTPQAMPFVRALTPDAFNAMVAECCFIVAHAGTGTILAAADAGKPLIVFPRRGDLRETRNDHQLATAKWMEDKQGVQVAWTVDELANSLDAHLHQDSGQTYVAGSPDRLIETISGFIAQ